MTIKEIIARFGQGQDPDENRAGYLDEEDLEKIDYYFAPGSLDLTDISALAEKVKVLTEIHDKAKKAQDEIAKAEADKAAIEEAEHKAAVKAWNKDQAEKKKAKPKPED